VTQADNKPKPCQPAYYEITVAGALDASWSLWFEDLVIEQVSSPEGFIHTCLHGWIVDQARLRSILTRLWDLNLTLLSVRGG
jgi:hypothetical protein